jgi:uncharacterized membrane protein
MLYQELHLRTAQVAAGSALIAGWVWAVRRRRSQGEPSGPRIGPPPLRIQLLEYLTHLANTQYRSCLLLLVGSFFIVASVAKHSQLHALALHAEDFWLFQDMLAQMRQGGFFITRYAPQAQGWVQHGAVHPMLSWALALPLSLITGPTLAALLFGPLVFSGAAWTLASIAKPRWGAIGALAIAAAFLASSQVGRVLMYDVHPEAAYPLGVLLWAWAAGWGDRKIRGPVLLFATLFTAGIKEDSFAVLLPMIAATAWRYGLLKRPKRAMPANVIALKAEAPQLPVPANLQRWLVACAALAAAITFFQFYLVHQYSSGVLGPGVWKGAPVTLPHGAELMRGRHWDSPASAIALIREILVQKGGILAALAALPKFLLSRPWLSLILVAPWVVLSLGFWISVLPLAVIFSVLDDPGKFINYYSAPVLGAFWLAAVSFAPERFKKPSILLWLLSLSLVLGGSGIDFYRSTDFTRQTRDEAVALASCLPAQKRGMVTGPFISLVPTEKILTDRVPPGDMLEAVDYYLFSSQIPSYEVGPAASSVLFTQLSKSPKWVRIGKNCQAIEEGENSAAFLFLRR